MVLIVCMTLIILFITGILIGMYLEYKDFNNGICSRCGKPLILFDADSQGGRGYCCSKCMHVAWVSYHWIDKKYKNKI